jgi:hypothetical protein
MSSPDCGTALAYKHSTFCRVQTHVFTVFWGRVRKTLLIRLFETLGIDKSFAQPGSALPRNCGPNSHFEAAGVALFQRVCELDLEGIVAKQKFGPYVTEREHSTWFKILNRENSQKDGREELFERDRRSEPVAGWHSCVLKLP